MSARDKSFLNNLGVKQKELAEALSVRPHTVSAGINDESNYLDLRKIRALKDHLEKHSKLNEEDFESEKAIYFHSPLELSPSLDDEIDRSKQVWIVGDDADEIKFYDKASSLYSKFSERKNQSLVFCISPNFPAIGLFNILKRIYEQSDGPEISSYVLQSKLVIPGLTMFLFDQYSSDSSALLQLYGGEMGRPFPALVEYYRSLFFKNGLGVDHVNFFPDASRNTQYEDINVLYTPEMVSGHSKI